MSSQGNHAPQGSPNTTVAWTDPVSGLRMHFEMPSRILRSDSGKGSGFLAALVSRGFELVAPECKTSPARTPDRTSNRGIASAAGGSEGTSFKDLSNRMAVPSVYPRAIDSTEETTDGEVVENPGHPSALGSSPVTKSESAPDLNPDPLPNSNPNQGAALKIQAHLVPEAPSSANRSA